MGTKNVTVGDTTTISLSGRLDKSRQLELEERLQEAIRGGSSKIVVNLKEVTYLSSSCIRPLLAANKELANLGKCLILQGASQRVQEVIKMSFSSVFLCED